MAKIKDLLSLFEGMDPEMEVHFYDVTYDRTCPINSHKIEPPIRGATGIAKPAILFLRNRLPRTIGLENDSPTIKTLFNG